MTESLLTVTDEQRSQLALFLGQMSATHQQSSVEISTNAKGEPQLCVKVYHSDPAVALESALELYGKGRILLRK